MNTIKNRLPARLLIGLILVGIILIPTGYWLWNKVRPQPAPKDAQIFQGIQYQRLVRQDPRALVIHVVTVDLRQEGISLLVTPGDAKAEQPLKARTTSQFLQEFELQIAINGDGFTPWYSNGPLDYYPKAGDPVTPLGLSASRGEVYAPNPQNHPVLYISRNNQARFNTPPGKIYNAISGNPMLVMQGRVAVGGKDNPLGQDDDSPSEQPQPRTAIGLDKNNRKLILVVVDGRQPGYSEGVTLRELAQIMIEAGALTAMNLDGGGSSTLARQGEGSRARVLNSPIDSRIPGRERNIANHLGVYAKPISHP
jgi:hypothetical protein